MIRMYKKILTAIIGTAFTALVAVSCVVPYEPKELNQTTGILVVEGHISVTGPFTIKISRTTNIASNNNVQDSIHFERYARVYVKDNHGNTYMSKSGAATGAYYFDFSDQMPDKEAQYQLIIESLDGNTYASDFREATYSSSMDLHYKIDTLQNKVIIYVDTYDFTGESTHYNWNFIETWDYVSQIKSFAYLDGYQVKKTEKYIPWMHRCWNSRESSEILLIETSALKEDRIKDLVIQTIEYRDIRITQHYSIEVIQTVLDKDAFLYMENMKKNSNDIGGLFSPQPHEISGNIRCVTDSSLRAVGFISVCNSVSKRLFIDCTGLPGYVREKMPEDTVISLAATPYRILRVLQMGYLPYLVDNQTESSYWNLSRCIDCRSKGGKPEVPSFWPAEWPTY